MDDDEIFSLMIAGKQKEIDAKDEMKASAKKTSELRRKYTAEVKELKVNQLMLRDEKYKADFHAETYKDALALEMHVILQLHKEPSTTTSSRQEKRKTRREVKSEQQKIEAKGAKNAECALKVDRLQCVGASWDRKLEQLGLQLQESYEWLGRNGETLQNKRRLVAEMADIVAARSQITDRLYRMASTELAALCEVLEPYQGYGGKKPKSLQGKKGLI